MKNTKLIALVSLFVLSSICLYSQKTEIRYLSGKGMDDAVEWDFYCTDGRKSGEWTKIPVPSCWEPEGFGVYEYGLEYKNKEQPANEKGLYKLSFAAPSDWRNKKVFIVFEGSMTETGVKINGKSAGAVHQGSFYRFQYDISKLIRYGKDNLLEVEVSKFSSNDSLNLAERRADYWIFGGIYRPVYLKIVPENHIERVAIDAKADGTFVMDVFHTALKEGYTLHADILDNDGKIISEEFSLDIEKGEEVNRMSTSIKNPKLWSAEFPNLYTLHLKLTKDGTAIHEVTEKFGFRTMELRARDGIYINGKRTMMKGVNRHSFWPSSGRTTSRKLSLTDVLLIKEMNMNAVRMAHYPPDKHFLEICDSLGLYVVNELAGWQDPPYDTETGKKLVKEMITRDVNHPSIIIWDNGNEGGWNPALDKEFHKYDIQKRVVIWPGDMHNDINTFHYRPYNDGTGIHYQGREVFMPTEFLHGLYDGGHGAGLEDFWELMMNKPLSAGGFLWVFTDEGVVRTDLNDSIDVDKNHAPDGILGPYREKEGSFFTIKEIWSPVYVAMELIPTRYNGILELENRYDFTNLSECRFEAGLKKFNLPYVNGQKVEAGEKHWVLTSPTIAPGNKGMIDLSLPEGWRDYDVLSLKATDPYGKEIFTWTWPVKRPSEYISETAADGKVEVSDQDGSIIVRNENSSLKFSKENGLLTELRVEGELLPLNNGPVIHSNQNILFKEISYSVNGNEAVVQLDFENEYDKIIWTITPRDIRLDYQYRLKRFFDYAGISFRFPEELVTGARYYGDGPYRVWKNRMKGTEFGLWDKKYNNTVTGESWDYPEFKGYYANFYAVRIENTVKPFWIINSEEDVFLHLFTPDRPKWGGNDHNTPPFPDGNISFLHGIPAIGTKFSPPEHLGPSGEQNRFFVRDYGIGGMKTLKKGRLYFRFE